MPSTLQLFRCLLNSLRLTASQVRLNVSHITQLVCELPYLLGNTMSLEESVVSRILILHSIPRPKLASRGPEIEHRVIQFFCYSAYPL
jgi:hypothetical protein